MSLYNKVKAMSFYKKCLIIALLFPVASVLYLGLFYICALASVKLFMFLDSLL